MKTNNPKEAPYPVMSKETQERHDSEWSPESTIVIKKNDFKGLQNALNEAKSFHAQHKVKRFEIKEEK